MMNNIVPFYSIFIENIVTHRVKNNIPFHSKMVGAMNGQSSVVALMHRVTSNVGLVDVSNHVEVDCVSS